MNNRFGGRTMSIIEKNELLRSKSPYQSSHIANEFINFSLRDNISDLTNMKIQKLVYFAHGWNLAFYDKPLLNEPIKAWKFGPVVESLYYSLKIYENSPVTDLISDADFTDNVVFNWYYPRVSTCDKETNLVLNEVWRVYGRVSAFELVKKTHEKGTPWYIATDHGKNIDIIISDNVIKLFFKNLMKE